MNNRRILILIVAVALAAVSAFATYSYASNADARASADWGDRAKVWMVAKDIEKGLSGERALDEGRIVNTEVPKKLYPAQAVVDANQLRGKVALAPMVAGQFVVNGSFVDARVANVSFADRIPSGMQAVTISVSDTQGVARLIVPGDKVNMIVNMPENPAAPNSPSSQRFMLQAVPVLAVGQAVEVQPGEAAPVVQNTPGQAQTVGSSLITFAVPAMDAARIVHASTVIGGIHLTLVPPDFKPAPVPRVNAANLAA
ncbi:MAG: Flp pilus assembly protein CpaB [Acidimicrobiia bacterium]